MNDSRYSFITILSKVGQKQFCQIFRFRLPCSQQLGLAFYCLWLQETVTNNSLFSFFLGIKTQLQAHLLLNVLQTNYHKCVIPNWHRMKFICHTLSIHIFLCNLPFQSRSICLVFTTLESLRTSQPSDFSSMGPLSDSSQKF